MQKMAIVMSLNAKLAMKMLFAVCIVFMVEINQITKVLPQTDKKEMMPYRKNISTMIPEIKETIGGTRLKMKKATIFINKLYGQRTQI